MVTGPGRMRRAARLALPRTDLSRYWWGQAASAFGSTFTAVALPIVAVIDLHASPGAIALISAAAVLPMLLLGLPAGALADRITRPRRTLLLLDSACALAAGTVAAGLAGHVASLGWLVLLSLFGGCASILIEVVYFVHLRQVAGDDGIGRARARLQAGEYGAGFAGRLLVGPVIVAFGAGAALGVDAVSYVLSALALLSMRPVAPVARERAESSPAAAFRSAAAGLRLLIGDAFQRELLLFIIMPVIAAAGTGTLIGPFLLRAVHVPASVYGLAFALSGLTGLGGSALASRLLGPRRNPRTLTLISFALSMACGLLLPLAAGPLPVAITVAALGTALPVFFGAIANVTLSTAFTADIPQDLLGRAVAALQVLAAAAGLAGALAGGAIGDWIGPRDALWAMDAGALGVTVLLLPHAIRSAARTAARAPSPSPSPAAGELSGSLPS